MYIGKLAKLAGCTPKAIRLYEEMGLFDAPQRLGRYRIYTQHHLDIVRLIRGAQAVGFKLSELSGVLAEKHLQQRFPLELATAGIEAKRLQVLGQIQDLHALDGRLVALRQQLIGLFGDDPKRDCPT